MTAFSTGISSLGPNPTTDEIDEVIHHLIDSHLEGTLSEEEARREICGAIYVSGIHQEEANRRTDLSQQGRLDLADRLSVLIAQQILSTEGKRSDFSFLLGRTTSPCGWARRLVRAAMLSELRNKTRSDIRNGSPLDPTGYEFAAVAQTNSSLIVFDAYAAHVDGELGDLIEQYTAMTRGMRETDRMVVNAHALCEGLGVAAPVRPETMADRDEILAAITADERLSHRSLVAFLDLLDGKPLPHDIDDRLLALWDEQTEDSAREIFSKNPLVAHTLVLAAVSPLPRPSKKSLVSLKAVVKTCRRDDRDWKELASALVDSYVASEFEAVSQYATMSVEAKQAAATGHTIARDRFDFLLHKAANHPGAPLGTTPARVLARLAEIAAPIFAADPSKAQTLAREMTSIGLGAA